MNANPYSALVTPVSVESRAPQAGLRHRVFRKKPFLTFTTTKIMKTLREQAEAFVNDEVGAEHVVAITEHVGFDFSVTIWYRVGAR